MIVLIILGTRQSPILKRRPLCFISNMSISRSRVKRGKGTPSGSRTCPNRRKKSGDSLVVNFTPR